MLSIDTVVDDAVVDVELSLEPATPAPAGSRLRSIAGRLWQRWRSDTLIRNSGYLMLTTIFNGAVGYAYWIMAARLGTTSGVGVATALIAILTLASIATNLGLGPALIQALPAVGSDDRRWSVMVNTGLAVGFGAGLVGSAAALVVLPVALPRFAPVLHHPVNAGLFIVGAGLFTIGTLVDHVFVSEHRGAQMLVHNVAFAAAKLGLIAVPVLAGARLTATGIVASWVVGTALAFGLGVMQMRRIGRHHELALRGAMDAWRRLRRTLAGHHLAGLGSNLPQYLLPAIVVARLSASANARFSITWTVGGIFFIISPAVAGALFIDGAQGPERLARSTRKAVILISGILGPAMAVFLVAGPLVMRAFGSSYAGSTTLLLRILVLSCIPDGVTNVYVSVLRVRRQLSRAAALNVAMGVSTLIGAWVLLPRLGIAGAGWAWIGAQTAGALAVGSAEGARWLRSRAA